MWVLGVVTSLQVLMGWMGLPMAWDLVGVSRGRWGQSRVVVARPSPVLACMRFLVRRRFVSGLDWLQMPRVCLCKGGLGILATGCATSWRW